MRIDTCHRLSGLVSQGNQISSVWKFHEYDSSTMILHGDTPQGGSPLEHGHIRLSRIAAGYGLRSHLPARLAPHASNPVLVHRLARYSTLLSDPASRRCPCFATTSPPSGCSGDFHPSSCRTWSVHKK